MTPSGPRSALPIPGSASFLAVSFAGLEFDIEGPDELLDLVLAVPLIERRQTGQRDAPVSEVGPPQIPSIFVRLREASPRERMRAARALGSRSVEWYCQGERGRALASHAYVEWQVVCSRFYAEAVLTASSRSAESLLTALASAALHRAGGAVLHAASVELPFGVVAFIGPSGAGKSTACTHVVGGRPFSVDRLALMPTTLHGGLRREWLAAPLPGGTSTLPGRLIGGSARGRRLALLARIHQTSSATCLQGCSRLGAFKSLRQSAFHAGKAPESELELLSSMDRLSLEVPFAHLHLRLGTSLEPLLCRWLTTGSGRVSTEPALRPGDRERHVEA